MVFSVAIVWRKSNIKSKPTAEGYKIDVRRYDFVFLKQKVITLCAFQLHRQRGVRDRFL